MFTFDEEEILETILVCSGCCNKILVAHKQHTLIFHSSADWEIQEQVASMIMFQWRPSSVFVAGALFLHSYWVEGGGISMQSNKSNKPILKAPHSWSKYSPKIPLPNTITLGIRISTCKFWEDANIQPIAGADFWWFWGFSHKAPPLESQLDLF